MNIKNDLKIWYGTFIRSVIVGGLFLFGNAVTTGFNFKGALIVAGGYLFLELAKKYGIDKEVNSKNKLNNYRFMLFP